MLFRHGRGLGRRDSDGPAVLGSVACATTTSRLVETPAYRDCQPLSKPAHVAFARKSNVRQLEPGTAIDEDLIRTVDQDVGHTRLVKQCFQWASADTVAQELKAAGFEIVSSTGHTRTGLQPVLIIVVEPQQACAAVASARPI